MPSRSLRLLLPVSLLLFAAFLSPVDGQTKKPAATAARPAARAPRPSQTAQQHELHRIREMHAAEYAKATKAARHELAVKLHERARLIRELNAERYVLWRESAHLWILAGDIPRAWKAIEELELLYAISAYELKAAALEAAIAKKEKLAEPAKFAQAAFLAFEDAKLFDPESAGRLLAFAKTTAEDAKDTTLITLATARTKDFERTRRDLDEGKQAVDALKKTPDDPAVNLKAGSYLCFARGDWAAGLPMLAKSSDNELQSLARSDLERPTDGASQISLGDSWFGRSRGMTGALKMHVLARACAWYREAAPNLSGDEKTRIEGRLAELESIPQVPLEGIQATVVSFDPVLPEPYPIQPTPTKSTEPWTVLFRSADPSIWNQKVSRGPTEFALPVADAPEDVRYLKLTNLATQSFVIIETSRSGLGSRATSGRYRWNGSGELYGGGYHLGIVDTSRIAHGKEFAGQIAIDLVRSNKAAAEAYGRSGWGFGNRSFLNDEQGFAWAGARTTSKTTFEIAVGKGPLTREEAAAFLSDDLDKLAEANGIAALSDSGDWKTIFRSSDPKHWGFADRRGPDGFAVDLRKVPSGIRYLKLADMSKATFVIIEITKKGLLGADHESRYGWHGTASEQNGATHLGIVDRLAHPAKGIASIAVGLSDDDRGGWGFGHRAVNGQGYSWAGVEAPIAVFDIAVKSGDLTSAEKAKLLPSGR